MACSIPPSGVAQEITGSNHAAAHALGLCRRCRCRRHRRQLGRVQRVSLDREHASRVITRHIADWPWGFYAHQDLITAAGDPPRHRIQAFWLAMVTKTFWQPPEA